LSERRISLDLRLGLLAVLPLVSCGPQTIVALELRIDPCRSFFGANYLIMKGREETQPEETISGNIKLIATAVSSCPSARPSPYFPQTKSIMIYLFFVEFVFACSAARILPLASKSFKLLPRPISRTTQAISPQ
jgi:hypothetical protein